MKKNHVLTSLDLAPREDSHASLMRNKARRARFVEALLHGSLDEARQFVEEGVDLHEAIGVWDDRQNLLLAVLKAGRLDSFDLLLQTRFAQSLLFSTVCTARLPVVVPVLRDELWRFPCHEGVMARLWELVGNNSYLAGLLGQLKCRHAARALYGVLRKRFKVAWHAYAEPKYVGRDVARMLAQHVWQSRQVN